MSSSVDGDMGVMVSTDDIQQVHFSDSDDDDTEAFLRRVDSIASTLARGDGPSINVNEIGNPHNYMNHYPDNENPTSSVATAAASYSHHVANNAPAPAPVPVPATLPTAVPSGPTVAADPEDPGKALSIALGLLEVNDSSSKHNLAATQNNDSSNVSTMGNNTSVTSLLDL